MLVLVPPIVRSCKAGCGRPVTFSETAYTGPGMQPLVRVTVCDCGIEQRLLPEGAGPELHWIEP